MAKKYATVHRGKSDISSQVRNCHEHDIRSRSVTPSTHTERNLYEDFNDLQNSQGLVSNNHLYQIDEYDHSSWGGNPIMHFGINGYSQTIIQNIKTHNVTQQIAIQQIPELKSGNASGASRYPAFKQNIILTTDEQNLVQHVAQHLVQNLAPSGVKAVLVDTFPRALKKDVSNELGDILTKQVQVGQTLVETVPVHTVILYTNQALNGQILVIDPNSPQFSGHLDNIFNVNISQSPSALHKPYTPPPPPQNASPGVSNTGNETVKWRDCVDISLKLAALLNLNTSQNYVDHNSVMCSKEVKFISNNAKIIGSDQFKALALRIKQISDLNQLCTFNIELDQKVSELDSKQITRTDDYTVKQEDLKQRFDSDIKQYEQEFIDSIDHEIQTMGQSINNGEVY